MAPNQVGHSGEGSKVAANQIGRNHAGLRKRMALFARLRSANRALPAAASDLGAVERRENAASALRAKLSELAARESPAEVLAKDLNDATPELDSQLQDMKQDLLERFDEIPFVSLRASIPRSVESHRPEVVALLEILLGERRALLERLPRVEYLITMLSTDEVDGRRNIVHDPVKLTPLLDNFSVDEIDSAEADAVAMELYQAATLDSDSEQFHAVLRELRARKQAVGLSCLTPTVLRAVVTYNARMFNSVESLAEAARVSDSVFEEALEESSESGEESPALDRVEEEPVEEPEEQDAISVFDSVALQSIIEGVRARIEGSPVGRRGPAERVAIILDKSVLESLESDSILAEPPSSEESLVARTTIVGLILRDLGPLENDLAELGIDVGHLSDAWVRELNESFGRLISQKLSDPKAYEQTSRLSGIKAKHLLKPYNDLTSGRRSSQTHDLSSGESSAEMRKIAKAAVSESAAPKSAGSKSMRPGSRSATGFGMGGSRGKAIAAAALVAIAIGLTAANIIGISPRDIKVIQPGALRHTSPFLQSAYRNDDGRGGLLIGRVDSVFSELSTEAKLEAAEEMVENFDLQGIEEAMLYDARGTLQVHYAFGVLNRPLDFDRSETGLGQPAVRRSLSGERLDESDFEDEEEGEWDGWDDEES